MHANCQGAPRCDFGDLWTFTPWKLTYEADLTTWNFANFQCMMYFYMFNATKQLFLICSTIAFVRSTQNEAEIGSFFQRCCPSLRSTDQLWLETKIFKYSNHIFKNILHFLRKIKYFLNILPFFRYSYKKQVKNNLF